MDPVVGRLARTLGVEPGEERVFVWGAAALFLAGWASVSVTNVAETLFLKRVGVELLPAIFLLNSLLLAGSTFAVGRLAIRTDHRRLLTLTFAALALSLLPLWLLVLTGVTSSFPILVIVAKQMDAIALLVFWTAIGGLLSARQGKRLFAPLTAGATLGTIVGSFASGPLGRVLGIPTLLPIAAAALGLGALATLPLRRWVPTRYHRAPRRSVVTDDPTRRLVSLWRQEGWLFRVLVLTSLLAGTLGPILYFEFSYVADLATQGSNGEQRLLDLYALLRGGINVGVLLIQIAGTAAVFRRVGVALASVLSPVIYLLGLAGLSIQLSLSAGIAAMAGVNLQDHAVYDPAQRILVTLFPERVRATVTTMIDGPVKRAGAVLGNLAILGALAVGSPIWVGWTGLPIAAAWLALTLWLWRGYPNLLLEVANARRLESDELLPLSELLDSGTVRVLEQSLASTDRERCEAACALIVEAPRGQAVAALARAARAAPIASRSLLITTLDRLLEDAQATPLTNTDAARDVAALLRDPAELDPLDRANLVQAYGRLLGRRVAASETRVVLTEAAEDEHEAVRIAAAAALHRSGSTSADVLDAVIAAGFASADPATRQVAREEIRSELLSDTADGDRGRTDARLTLLASHLASPADRAHAATALADVAARHGPRIAAHVSALLPYRTDPDIRVRIATLRAIGSARLARESRWLISHLRAEDHGEVAAARGALLALGPDALDVLLGTLRHGARRTREAVLPILVGLPVDPANLQTLVDREVHTIRELLLQADALRAGGISELVLQRLRERIDESLHTALLSLAAQLDDDRIARVCHLLGRAWSVRDRAVLLEALEALLPTEERERLLPLIEDQSPQVLAKTAARALRRPLPSFDEAVAAALASEDPLTCALLARTLEPAMLARHAPHLDPVAAEQLLAPPRTPVDAAAPAPDPVDGERPAVPYESAEPPMLSSVETILHLRSLDIFERLTTRQLTELAGVVTEVAVPAGRPIVQEGDFDDCMYLIVSGRVRITKAGAALADVGPREFFGEMAVFDGETRSATVIADVPTRLLRLARHDLFEVMEEQPSIAIAICQTLTRRVRDLLDERAAQGEPRTPPERDGD